MTSPQSPWRIGPAVLCFAVTMMVPIAFFVVVGGLEYAGHKDLALLIGWITIPLAMAVVPAGLILTVVLALTGKRQR